MRALGTVKELQDIISDMRKQKERLRKIQVIKTFTKEQRRCKLLAKWYEGTIDKYLKEIRR